MMMNCRFPVLSETDDDDDDDDGDDDGDDERMVKDEE